MQRLMHVPMAQRQEDSEKASGGNALGSACMRCGGQKENAFQEDLVKIRGRNTPARDGEGSRLGSIG
jgi:hypothetical protein